ncbi:acid protease [Sistotremastrum suecicum HHB10207 ss-3]|uniref:Acid protease n=1 Tax=Sistotremastrum suecicum HHB10207 ss-3 TaxID=1314776 RepID=A0A166HIK4_9AGAM|nr:acid protease [Sistotremastrum suecicum HHB10207 ss-3]
MFWLPWMLLLTGQLLVEAQLFKRDTVVGTLTIPLALDSNKRYLARVTMGSVGTPQIFNFTLSTTMGYVIVANTGCSNCLAQTDYNPSQSKSEKNLGGNQTINVAGSFATGTLIKEDCTLPEVNGSAWNYPNQTIMAVTSSNQTSQEFFSTEASGIFGMGLTGPNLSFRDTLYGGFFFRNPHLNNFTYGMALNPPYGDDNGAAVHNQSAVGGFLHWEFPDSSAYTGPVTQVSVMNGSEVGGPGAQIQQAPIAASGDWTIQIDGWTAEVNNSQVMHTTPNMATLDPYFPEIYLTQTEAALIYAAIPGSSPSDQGLFTQWTIPCGTQLTWAISVQSTPFIVPSSTLVIQNGTTCVGAIVGWTDPGATTYLLGSSFISAVYMIFSVGLPGDQPTTIGIAVRSQASHKNVNVGAIVGGVIGGVAVLAIILFGIWFILFKHGHLGPKRDSIGGTRVINASSEPEKAVVVAPLTSPPLTGGSMNKQGFVTDTGDDSVYYPPTPVSSTPGTYGQSAQNESGTPTSPVHIIQDFSHVDPRVTAANRRGGSAGVALATGNSGLVTSVPVDGRGGEAFEIDGGNTSPSPTSPLGNDWVVEPFYPPSQPTDGSQPRRKGEAPEGMAPAPLRIDTGTPAPAYQHSSNGQTELSPTQTLVQPIGDPPARRRRKN